MKTIIFTLIASISLSFYAQTNVSVDSIKKPHNIIKTNLTSMLFRNFELQYERVFTKRISLNINAGFIPKGNLPLKSIYSKYVDDEDIVDLLNIAIIEQKNFVAELRFYLGKGYSRGFYLAPFYNYADYGVEDLKFEYEDDTATTQNILTKGNIHANTVGLLIGKQYNLGKNFVLDLWFLGAQYGLANGDINGKSSRPLSPQEQQELKNEIDNLDVPLVNLESTVSATDIDIKVDGPWAGLRCGISLGYSF